MLQVAPIGKLVLMICLIIVHLLIISEVSSVEVPDVYKALLSHFGLTAAAFLRIESYIMLGLICFVTSLHAADLLLERYYAGVVSHHPTIHENLCRWLSSGAPWLALGSQWMFCVTREAIDIQLMSRASSWWIFLPQMIPLASQVWSICRNWEEVVDLSSGSACQALCCVDDMQHCSPAASRRGDWSSKTTHPESTTCVISPRSPICDLRVESYKEYRLNCKYRRPVHKPERWQSPYATAKSRRHRMCSPYDHPLADAQPVQ
ncbi:uncharacterized protein EDB91DRAFT_1113494 [Suillus paluster]|uniref:uncharacterized protein n=1 Tax=Suillus paluster TaxID=48578 RepID=UPI001B861131|nr:uncharacterized protein EDB91DRAFT_1113494 [Suillus paluster]KAG1748340.1 hypothetical protein EDB91DRAFT_1113494 [Suillus paluster]